MGRERLAEMWKDRHQRLLVLDFDNHVQALELGSVEDRNLQTKDL